jgi:hypothetical protein
VKESARKSTSAKREHYCEHPYLYNGELVEADAISQTGKYAMAPTRTLQSGM